jgi:hypothetical protein
VVEAPAGGTHDGLGLVKCRELRDPVYRGRAVVVSSAIGEADYG